MLIFTSAYQAMMWGSMTDGPCSILINDDPRDFRGARAKGIFICDGTGRGPNSGPFRVGGLPANYAA